MYIYIYVYIYVYIFGYVSRLQLFIIVLYSYLLKFHQVYLYNYSKVRP